MKIRNKRTGQVFEVMKGTLYPHFYEEVKDEEIIVGEPKVEYIVEKTQAEQETEAKVVEKPAKKAKKSTKRKNSKKGKKNDKD